MEKTNAKTIMLVDDDSFLLDMYAMKFKARGWDPITLSNSEEALNKLREGYEPTVLVVDIIMPKIDGIAFYKEVKSKNLAKSSVKIVLTNQGEKADLDKVADLGLDGYIIKALNTPTEVVEKVLSISSNKS